MSPRKYQRVRGTYDVLPADQSKYEFAAETFKELAKNAGFGRIDTPVIEEAQLFHRSVGDDSEIVVEKQMYEFADQSGNQLALRPEGTAGAVRAYIENGLASSPKPVKLYYAGPMFRYERPQAGRYRQHTQLGVEVLGDDSPSIDAHVIMLALRFYQTIGLRSVSLQLNSLGDEACQAKYRKALVEYLQSRQKDIPKFLRERIASNPLRLLDSKEEAMAQIIKEAPQTLNFLTKPAQNHFRGVLEYLDELDVPYELNPTLVRGLDYYNRTLFEFQGGRAGAQSAIGGGGRYDKLVESLGGQPTPAIGFGIGVERVLMELDSEGAPIPGNKPVKVYVASLGEPARIGAFRLIEQLLDGGVGAIGSVEKDGIQSQLSKADKAGVPYAIIIGQKEVFDGSVILRDMDSGAQENIPVGKIVRELQKRFG